MKGTFEDWVRAIPVVLHRYGEKRKRRKKSGLEGDQKQLDDLKRASEDGVGNLMTNFTPKYPYVLPAHTPFFL